MLKDIPYSLLKQNKIAYEIMLFRDQHDNSFTDIAKECGLSVERVSQLYKRLKVKQIQLYINHIAVVLEHDNISQVREIYNNAYECYQDWTYTCAYLEKKYKNILDEYRNSEPGMPNQFIRSIPPFKEKISEKTIARVIEMREVEKTSFVTIAKTLHMTQAKAKHTYELFYHKQILEHIKALQEKAESEEEKRAIWSYCFRGYKSPKKRYDMLIKEYSQLT